MGGVGIPCVWFSGLSQCGESPHWERPEKPQPHYKVRSMELPEGVCSSDSESVAESEVESKSCEEVEPLPPKKAKVGLTIKKKYKQKYRKAWEKEPSFKGWLKPVNHKPAVLLVVRN